MDLSNSFQIWRQVLTTPGVPVFAEQRNKKHATLATAVIWMVGAGLILFILWAILFTLTDPIANSMDASIELMRQLGTPDAEIEQNMALLQQSARMGTMIGLFLGTIFVPVTFLLGSGLIWVISRMLGGMGTYTSQTYLLATFTAPITILTGLLSFLPLLGTLLVLALNIYQLALTYYALQAAHGFTSGRAVTAVLAPLLLGFLFVCCALFILSFIIAAVTVPVSAS